MKQTEFKTQHCLSCKHFVVRQGNTKTRYLCSFHKTTHRYDNGNAITCLLEVSPVDSCGLFRGFGEPELPALTNGGQQCE